MKPLYLHSKLIEGRCISARQSPDHHVGLQLGNQLLTYELPQASPQSITLNHSMSILADDNCRPCM